VTDPRGPAQSGPEATVKPDATGPEATVEPGVAGPEATDEPRPLEPDAADEPVGQLELRPPRHQVDPRAKSLWATQAGISAVVTAVVVAILTAAIEPIRPLFPWAVAVALVGGAAYTVAMPRVRYRVHRWEVTDVAVYTRAGWLTHEWRVAPLSRVQTVDARRSPLEQVFGLSSVRVTTASASGDVSVEGLDRQLAADLVEMLTARTQATPGDAT
jgi:membrane protein YdbS with pleckstrin-like domain